MRLQSPTSAPRVAHKGHRSRCCAAPMWPAPRRIGREIRMAKMEAWLTGGRCCSRSGFVTLRVSACGLFSRFRERDSLIGLGERCRFWLSVPALLSPAQPSPFRRLESERRARDSVCFSCGYLWKSMWNVCCSGEPTILRGVPRNAHAVQPSGTSPTVIFRARQPGAGELSRELFA
jgi:hypothetical protein